MILSVLCPNCGEVLKWDSNEEPLELCGECGYELSIEDEYCELIWKKNVRVFEDEVLQVCNVVMGGEQ